MRPTARILASELSLIGVPISEAALNEGRERDDRLASKYGVKLPDRPAERLRSPGRSRGGYFVRKIPYGLGGDPNREGSLSAKSGMVMPYWWPIQPEEWDLDHWTARGFDIFVLMEGAGFSDSGNPLCDEPRYRAFHEQIIARSDLVQTLPTIRHLFSERTIRIYRLRRPEAPPPPR